MSVWESHIGSWWVVLAENHMLISLFMLRGWSISLMPGSPVNIILRLILPLTLFCDNFAAPGSDISVVRSFDSGPDSKSSTFLLWLRVILKECGEALKRQLSDFLAGWKFAEIFSSGVVEIPKTCPLTNLTGELLFGDLDYCEKKTEMQVWFCTLQLFCRQAEFELSSAKWLAFLNLISLFLTVLHVFIELMQMIILFTSEKCDRIPW